MNRSRMLSTGLSLFLAVSTAAAQEARTVQYHAQDIVPIHAKLTIVRFRADQAFD